MVFLIKYWSTGMSACFLRTFERVTSKSLFENIFEPQGTQPKNDDNILILFVVKVLVGSEIWVHTSGM